MHTTSETLQQARGKHRELLAERLEMEEIFPTFSARYKSIFLSRIWFALKERSLSVYLLQCPAIL